MNTPNDYYSNDLEGAAGHAAYFSVPDWDEPDYEEGEDDDTEPRCGCGSASCPECRGGGIP